MAKRDAIYNIHLPHSEQWLHQARRRLKFEELFYNQLRLIKQKVLRRVDYEGQIFKSAALLKTFYDEYLPFPLTNAQKRVIKEIFADMRMGRQMNRLLQGDVGSGKTIVAFICMLLAIDNGAQACLMAPTEILADQHYNGLKEFAELLGIRIEKLTGSTKKKARALIHEGLLDGSVKIIVGTHALLEDIVQFQNLGLCVIDEQHRFGVAQRAKLWEKNKYIHPHILVMTATPIPRTLAMTAYADLDTSIIDELPPGRTPVTTVAVPDTRRAEVVSRVRQVVLEHGRQAYCVLPVHTMQNWHRFSFQHCLSEQRVDLEMKSRISTNNIFVVKALCQNGLGLARVLYLDVQKELMNGELIEVLPDWKLPSYTLYAVAAPIEQRSVKTQRCIEALKTYFSQIPGGRLFKAAS